MVVRRKDTVYTGDKGVINAFSAVLKVSKRIRAGFSTKAYLITDASMRYMVIGYGNIDRYRRYWIRRDHGSLTAARGNSESFQLECRVPLFRGRSPQPPPLTGAVSEIATRSDTRDYFYRVQRDKEAVGIQFGHDEAPATVPLVL